MSCRVRIIDSLRYLVPDLCTSAAELERNHEFLAEWRSATCIVTDQLQHASLAPIIGNLAIYTTFKGRWHFRLPGRWDSVSPNCYLLVNDGHGLRSRIAANQDVLPFAIFFERGLVDEVTRTVGARDASGSIVIDDAVRIHVPRLRNLLRHIAFHAERGLAEESWYYEHLRMVLEIVLADGVGMPGTTVEAQAREPPQSHRYVRRPKSRALRTDSRRFGVAHAEDELRRGSTSLAALAKQMRISHRLLLRWLVRHSSFTVDELRWLRQHGRIPLAGADHEPTCAAGSEGPLPSRRFSQE